MPVQSISPQMHSAMDSEREKKTKKYTNIAFSHLQPAGIVYLPQTLHGDRGRRDH